MPYVVKRVRNKFKVFKQGARGRAIGAPLGTHPSRQRANMQMRALYARVPDATREKRDPMKQMKRRPRYAMAGKIYPHEGERHREVFVDDFAEIELDLAEAATLKSKVQQLMRDAEDILDARDGPEHVRQAVTTVRAEMRRTWADLSGANQMENDPMPKKIQVEEVMKTVGGQTFPASECLVVEDSDQPSTWHLQVKERGRVNRRLLGAAKAALTAPQGHRGNKYEGPGKTEAIRKLKALYKSEDMAFEAAVEEDYGMDMPAMAMPAMGATSFADLDAAEQAKDEAGEVQERVYQLTALINNVLADMTIEDKPAALKQVTDEFIAIVNEIFSMGATEAAPIERPA